MAVYNLLTNVTVVQPAPTVARGPVQPVIAHGPDNPNMPAQSQAFLLRVAGIGAVSATAQVVASNDGTTWFNYGDPLVATGTDAASKPSTSSQPYKYFGAYITAISGTQASANLTMSA